MNDCDVLVAGAGGAGLAAALAAARAGATVVLVEARETFRRGCNTAMSTSMIPAAGTRWQTEAGVTVNVHPAFFDKLGAGDRLSRYYFESSFAAPVEASIGLMSVIHSGLLDRHPDLRMCFTHGGGIAIHSLGRFDHRFHMIGAGQRTMARPPSEYLSAGNLFYDVLVHDVKALELVIERVGVDQLTIGTDHPFAWDHPGGAANWIRDADFLDAQAREKILWRNAARLYGLDTVTAPGSPATLTAR